MFQLVDGLILGKDKENLVHGDLIPPILKYRLYPSKSYQSSFKVSVALA
jgi:hypothetical protein